jgi:nitrous oxidase accessory protein
VKWRTLAALAALALVGRRGEALEGPPPPKVDAGTFARAIPEAAIVAETSDDLARMLADEKGPREIWLRDRVYRGDFVIARTLALHGTGGTTLEGTGNGTVLTIDAADSTIDDVHVRRSGRRFTIEDSGIKAKAPRARISHVDVADCLFGIELAPCPSCILENSRVTGPDESDKELRGDGVKLWEAHDATVRSCTVDHGRDVVVWYSRRAVLDGNVVRHGRYGAHFMYSHDAIVKNSRLEDNVVGVFVMYSARLRVEHDVLAGARGPAGMGIGFKESDGVSVTDTWIVANTTGAYLDRTPRDTSQTVAFDHDVFALNDVALRFLSSQEGLSFTHDDFHQNVEVAAVEGGGDALGVTFDHDHWTDYEGYDLDHDGTGDVRFEVKKLSSELTDAHPSLRFFQGTGALALFDAVARAVPVLSSKTLLVDEHPSMNAERPR